jgi:Uncharacterised nucleotidyltransferase
MLRHLTREARFLLYSAHNPDLESHRLQNLIAPDLNWDSVFRAAEMHALIPLVYRTLSSGSVMAPSGFVERLRSHALKIAGRNAVLKRELVRTLQLFERQGIQTIAYKGPVLAERLYGNISLRYFDDLDLLLREQDILKAKDLLLKQGYRPKKDLAGLNAAQEKAFLEFHYTYDFISRNSGHQLEIHWKIVPKTFSLDLDYEGIWNRSLRVAFEGLTVGVFSPEDLLLILCVGGTKHVWKRLSRIVDIAQTLRLHPDLDWEQTLSHAKKAGAERILLVGISLASILFEEPLPSSIQLQTEQDPIVKSLTKRIIDGIFSAPPGPAAVVQPEDQFQPMHVFIRERFVDRFSYCLRLALTPSVGEWSVIALPRYLYFLYYPLRPVRLVCKGINRVMKHFFSKSTKSLI